MVDDDMNDFGFTFFSEEEFVENNDKVQVARKDRDEYGERLTKLYQAIQPLLKSLAADPEKEHIKWPNRAAEVEAFKKTLENIYYGKK